MSDNPTRETPDSHSFEERIFARFDAFERRFDAFERSIEARFSRLEEKVDAMERRFSRLEEKVDAMDTRLTTLEGKVDERLRETRPIWEAMQANIAYLKDAVKEIKRTLKVMHTDLLRVRAEQDDLEERVEKIESELSRKQ
jgi:chromosome segregation ATPase